MWEASLKIFSRGREQQDIGRNFPPARNGYWVTSLSQTLCWIARDPRWCAGRFLARCVQVAIKGLRGMDVRRGPMQNDRGLHGLAVTRS